MNVVHEDVKQCVENELQHAVSVFGLHHSNHEKMALIAEEFEECAEAVENMRQSVQQAWERTKRNNVSSYDYGHIYDDAVAVAIESCQVAAMAQKEIEEPKEIAEPAELVDHGLYSGNDPVRVFRCTNCGNDFASGIHPHPLFCPRCGEKFSNVLIF